MKVSRTKFIVVFLLSAFTFQFISNSLLGTAIKLFPRNGEWYPGADSPIGWKRTVAALIYPVKYVLIEPLSFLNQDPDPAPPVPVIAFAAYWTLIALVLHFLLSLTIPRTKA